MNDVIDTTKVVIAGAYSPTGKLLASGLVTSVENIKYAPSDIYRNNEMDEALSTIPKLTVTVTFVDKPTMWQKIKKAFKNLWQ